MGHARDCIDSSLIDQLLQGCDDLLSGKQEKDIPIMISVANASSIPLALSPDSASYTRKIN